MILELSAGIALSTRKVRRAAGRTWKAGGKRSSASLEGPITGYAYRDHPERFEVHIHRFLDYVQRREYR